jgi:Bacterial membrane protein YfhO
MPRRWDLSAGAGLAPDALGVAWVVVAAFAILFPALAHGASLGPFDQLSRYGLTTQRGVVVHYTGPGDQIEQMIPWTFLAWTQVHHGHLPLWNPYSALGVPLAFNWQSATFGVPALLGYLFPVHLAYTVAQLATVLIAGGGVYFLGRVLRLGVLGATMAATVYELSGPLMGWLGWPNAAAMSWAGWIFAMALLIVAGRHRARDITLFAVFLACAVYAGQPETVVLFAMALTVFVAVYLALRARGPDPGRGVLGPLVDLGIASVAGAALSAPLALPGLQLASMSVVHVVSSYGALAPHDLGHVLFQGFDGLPVAGNRWFGNSIYPETAAYVGVIAVALAIVAVGVRRRRPEVPALVVTALSMAVVAYGSPAISVINQITGLRTVAWHRAVQPMVLALAVLAGMGMDVLVRSHAERRVRRWAWGAFGASAVVVGLFWLFGRGRLPSVEAGIRARSFVWPAIETVLGLAVVAGLAVAAGRRRARHGLGSPRPSTGSWAGLALLLCETAFLVAAGAPLVSSSSTFLTPAPAVSALRNDVGSALVAFATRDCHTPPTLGIHQNLNIVYEVRELAVYDPITPEATFRSLKAATGQPASALNAPLILCPAVDNATVARSYGVGFILQHATGPRPSGTVLVSRLGDETLYRVPGGAAATLTPLPAGGTYPPPYAPGTPVTVTYPGPASWKLTIDAPGADVLRLHLTDVPGWHATMDGRPLDLDPLAGTMLQARVPSGHHVVELRYWPTAFTTGIVLAVVSVIGLAGGLVVGARRRRRRLR